MQEELTRANGIAWNTKAYQAWVTHHGHPEKLAEELRLNHKHHLRRWLKYIGNPAGMRVLNLMGSHGRKGIALAMMGADVTIVDISNENQRYALEVAASGGVEINYINADVLNIPDEESLGEFEIVLMEFGILHYFSDLSPLFSLVNRRLTSHGRYILTDFHPFTRKLLNHGNNGLELKQDGDYFDKTLKEGDLAYADLLPEENRDGLPKCLLRGWTVGEILTALGTAGLCIRSFEEEPDAADGRIPAFYTVVADKMDTRLAPLYP